MYRVNAPKIRGKMSEKGYTIASLAQGIGVNLQYFSGVS